MNISLSEDYFRFRSLVRWYGTKLYNITPIFGPGSAVGKATGYGLEGPGIESCWGARFSPPIQTGPGVHAASCTMGTGSFPWVKSGRGVMLTPHPFLVPWSRRRRAITLHPLWAVLPVQSLSAVQRCTLPFFTPTVIEPLYLNTYCGANCKIT